MIYANKRTGRIWFLRNIRFRFFNWETAGQCNVMLFCKYKKTLKQKLIKVEELIKDYEFIGTL